MPKPQPKTLAGFRAVHDDDVVIPNRIRAQIAAMLAIGKEEHDYESDFLRNAKVSNSKISAYRNDFKKHIVETRDGKRVWFASAAVATLARKGPVKE